MYDIGVFGTAVFFFLVAWFIHDRVKYGRSYWFIEGSREDGASFLVGPFSRGMVDPFIESHKLDRRDRPGLALMETTKRKNPEWFEQAIAPRDFKG